MSLIIGLTGGIGSGKSTVSNYLRGKNLTLLCADKIAHQIMQPGQIAYRKIVKKFGKEILSSDKTINRKILGPLVFKNPNHLKSLNAIAHPEVLKEFKKQIRLHKKEKYIILDVPLLFESGMDKICDHIILVALNRKIQSQRIKKRDGITQVEIKRRINSQMPLREKKKRSNFVINNSGTWTQTKKQIEKLIKQLT